MAEPPDGTGWEAYYHAIEGRAPRALLQQVLQRYSTPAPGAAATAIDLGCGDGTETLALLQQGWHVLAVDRQPEAIARVQLRVPAEWRDRLETQVAGFEEAVLPQAVLVYAGVSLPFCSPQTFPYVWAKIVSAVLPGGRFAGHLFGERDAWANDPEMTFFTAGQARRLFEGFDLEQFEESEQERKTATQGVVHSHAFEIIARKL